MPQGGVIRSAGRTISLLLALAMLGGGIPGASGLAGASEPLVIEQPTVVGSPVVIASAALSSSGSTGYSFPVSWTLPNGMGQIAIEYKDGEAGAWTPWRTAAAPGSALFAGRPGRTYWFRGRDASNPAAAWSATSVTTVAYDDRVSYMRYRGRWVRKRQDSAYGGAVVRSTKAGSVATMGFNGKRIALVGTRGPDRGKVAIYLDGSRRPARVIDTYSSTLRRRSVLYQRTFTSSGHHTISVKLLKTRGRTRVDVDAIAVVRPDLRPPSVTRVAVAGQPAYVATRSVALQIDASDNVGVTEMQLSASPTFADAQWRPYAKSAAVTLPAGDGAKTIYARFRDQAANVSAVATTRVVLDTSSPAVTGHSADMVVKAGSPRQVWVRVDDASPLAGYATIVLDEDSAETTVALRPSGGKLVAEVPAQLAGVTANVYFEVADAAGNKAATSNTLLSWSSTVPAAPAGVSGSGADRRVDLTWNSASGATGYEVWRSDDHGATWSLLSEQAHVGYRDTAVSNGKLYCYEVAVIGARGERGARSALLEVVPEAFKFSRPIVLDTSAAGWNVAGDVTDAFLPVKVPADVLERCETSTYSDIAFRDGDGHPIDTVARVAIKNGGTRSVGYTMSNKILTHDNGRSRDYYFTYSRVRQLEGYGMATAGQAVIVKYESATRRTTETVMDQLITDNHGGYAIWFDSSGRLNAVGGGHNTANRHYRAATPYEIDMVRVDDNVSGAPYSGTIYHYGSGTYPSMSPGPDNTAHGILRLNGTLERPGFVVGWHFFDGAKWSPVKSIVRFSSPKGTRTVPSYENFVIDASDGRSYVFAHRFQWTPSSRGMGGYVMYTDTPASATPTFRRPETRRPVAMPANEATMMRIGRYSITDNTRLIRIGRDAAGFVYVGTTCLGGPRAGLVDIYRIKAGTTPTLMGSLDTRRITGKPASSSTVAFSVVGSQVVAIYDGSGFGRDAGSELHMSTSSDWGRTWTAFKRVTNDVGGPSWLPATPMQDMGGDEPAWPMPFGYQVGGSGSEGQVFAKFAEVSESGQRTFLTSSGLEVWAFLRGMTVKGNTPAQTLAVRFGDANAEHAESPSSDPEMRMLQAFTSSPFGPFEDLSSARTTLEERGRVYKTSGAYSGVGWGADVRGGPDYIAGPAATIDPAAAPMTFVALIRPESDASGVLFDSADANGGGMRIWRDGSGWNFGSADSGLGHPFVSTGASQPARARTGFHTLAFTRDGSSGSAYVDGARLGVADTFGSTSLGGSAATFVVGRDMPEFELGLMGMWVGEAWSPDQMRLLHAALTNPSSAE